MVRVVKPGADLLRDVDDVFRGQRLALIEHAMQRDPLDVFHGDVEQAVLLARVVNRDDVAVVENAREARLVLEPAQHLVGLQAVHVEAHGLERDRSSNGRVDGLVHPAHRAFTQLTRDLVAADFFDRLARFHRPLRRSGRTSGLAGLLLPMLRIEPKAYSFGGENESEKYPNSEGESM